MNRVTLRGVAAVFGIATVATLIVAWPVVRSPAELVYGREIAGRQSDTYTIIGQFGSSGAEGAYAQPLTDRLGWLIGRVVNPVAAFNVVVLLSFPLTAAATYALALYVLRRRTAAFIAAFAFTFAPLRLAHAAYHPHIVQTQWLAVYLLALFALVDRVSWLRAAAVAAAAIALGLSNLYGALVGAAIAPVAMAAYWFARRDSSPRPAPLAALVVTVLALSAIGLALIAWRQPALLARPSPFAVDIADVGRHSARWWAYLTPPIDHPLMGASSLRTFERAHEQGALVEQQVFTSYALLALAAFGIVTCVVRWRRDSRFRPLAAIAVLGAWALLVSLGPASGSCTDGYWAPACLMYRVAPMFRSYARFAFAVHLAVAICAGAGAVMLAERSRFGRAIAIGLLAVAAIEYWPLPWRAHDVLPTAGHRWVMRHASGPVFDCVELQPALATLPFLMNRSVSFLSETQPTCADPRIGNKLAVLHYTYLLARRDAAESQPPEQAAGLLRVAQLPDAQVFSVSPARPLVAVVATEGFFDFERAGDDWWQWMTSEGRWIVESGAATSTRVSLALHLSSAGWPREIEVTLDGRPAGRLHVGTNVDEHLAGPFDVTPGTHMLAFRASGPAFRPSDAGGSTDTRALTVMFKSDERWIQAGQ